MNFRNWSSPGHITSNALQWYIFCLQNCSSDRENFLKQWKVGTIFETECFFNMFFWVLRANTFFGREWTSILMYLVESVQDFLIKLDMKPCMHLVEISIFSLNHVIVRLTKILNNLLEHIKIHTFKVIFLY